jgi:hypothetical protein
MLHPEFGTLEDDKVVVRQKGVDVRSEPVIARLAHAFDRQRPPDRIGEHVFNAGRPLLKTKDATHERFKIHFRAGLRVLSRVFL